MNLLKKAFAGEGEMPPPYREYRALMGIEVPKHWHNHVYAKDKPKPTKPKKAVKKSDRGCVNCKWRGKESSKAEGNTDFCCNYALMDEHHSRVYLHYKRTGMQSLKGMTHDSNCTEWEQR